MSRRWVNPARLVAELVGASPRDTVRTAVGGNSPGLLLNDTAAAIAAGQLDVALLCGVEAIATRRLARRQGVSHEWSRQPDDTPPPRILGTDREAVHEAESARGLAIPIQYYPLFENSTVRAEAPDGRSATFQNLGTQVDAGRGTVGLLFREGDLR